MWSFRFQMPETFMLCGALVWAWAVTVRIVVAKQNFPGGIPPWRKLWSAGNWPQLGVCWFGTLLPAALMQPRRALCAPSFSIKSWHSLVEPGGDAIPPGHPSQPQLGVHLLGQHAKSTESHMEITFEGSIGPGAGINVGKQPWEQPGRVIARCV